VTDEEVIAKYKADLVGEAEIARSDLDEIEDHLRLLADELRTAGMPRLAAVREACVRLGNPRDLAREHARVRSPFGARLSGPRTLSAIALLLPILALGAVNIWPSQGVWSVFGIQIVAGFGLIAALALRLAWARPILLGGMSFFTIQVAVAQFEMPTPHPLWLIPYAGTLAFVMPWRRNELTANGLSLALQVWAFGAAAYALGFQISTPTGYRYISQGAEVALFATTIAVAGTILRAKWSALASAVSAVTLVMAFIEISPLKFNFGFPQLMYTAVLLLIGTGALAAAVGTILSWRNARSVFGSLQHVLR
jgi:hypothetical protein